MRESFRHHISASGIEMRTFSAVWGLKLALCTAVLGLVTVAFPLQAQLCNGTTPPCVLTAGYAGPATDASFNSRQAMNPYEKHFSPTVLPSSTTASLFLPVDTNDLPVGAISNPIMAQPLYVAGITVANPQQGPCNPCNMVIAVTLNDTVFAWNADGTGAGNLLWSRQGDGTNQYGGNALWYDDCGAGGGPGPGSSDGLYRGQPTAGTLQFAGILSTPVIDASGSTPVMYLTSSCQTNSGTAKWYFHEVNLQTGQDVAATDIGNDVRNMPDCPACEGFTSAWQFQRPSLLEVQNPGNTSTPVLIYILFGVNTYESQFGQPYAGWVVAYTASAGTVTPVFAYSDEPTSCGAGGGYQGTKLNGQCNTNPNPGSPTCDCYTGVTTIAPNWGGHGAGCWMSGSGPAASEVGAVNNSGGSSDNAVHVFFGCGNGGFQNSGLGGASLDNFGQTLMDFRLTPTGYDSNATGPFQTFTPNSPAHGVAPKMRNLCGCTGNGTQGCGPCKYTFQNMNVLDYDMSTSGVALFKDLAGNQRLVTVDKGSFGYLLTQGNLCGSGTLDSTCVGFASGDPGSWTFGAAKVLCTGEQDDCDRVTSMAVFDNRGSGSKREVYLNYWPYRERLTALRLSDNSTPQSGKGQLTTDTSVSASTMMLSASCVMDENCLTEQLVVGDTLTLDGCTCQGGNCPVVTSLITKSTGDSELTLNMTVASAFGSSCSFPQSFQYTGYFVTPAHNATPYPAQGSYPGAALTVTANCTTVPCTNALVWSAASNAIANGTQRPLGTLYAHSAVPNASNIMREDWHSTDAWCASRYARPMIVNGSAFVPTTAVSNGTFPTDNGTTLCPVATQESGAPYPSGILVYR